MAAPLSLCDLDIVIPTLNAAATLPGVLASLGVAVNRVIVADGGSTDETPRLARAAGARLVSAPRGRGSQLMAGVAAGSAPWLLVVHADSRLSPAWPVVVSEHMDRVGAGAVAGYFTLRFDSPHPAARRIERVVAWRARALGLPYGDQGLLIGRAFYDSLGGYRPLPLMEDVDLVRRIGRRSLLPLPAEAITSAVRYERDGWLRRPARNLVCLALYAVGVPPRLIHRLYG